MPGVTLGATFRDGHERGLGDPSGRLYPPGGEASQAWQSGSAGLSTASLSRKPSLLLQRRSDRPKHRRASLRARRCRRTDARKSGGPGNPAARGSDEDRGRKSTGVIRKSGPGGGPPIVAPDGGMAPSPLQAGDTVPSTATMFDTKAWRETACDLDLAGARSAVRLVLDFSARPGRPASGPARVKTPQRPVEPPSRLGSAVMSSGPVTRINHAAIRIPIVATNPR